MKNTMKNTMKTMLVILLTMPIFGQTVQESIEKLRVNANAIEEVVNGPATGDGSSVVLPQGGAQDTLAKMSLQFQPIENQLEPFVIVVAGQSNALGRGTETASMSKSVDSKLEIWNLTAGQWQAWDLASNSSQLSPTITSDGTSGLGPTNNAYNFAYTMGKHVIKESGRKVKVIIEAEGGENIDNFIPASSGHWARLINSLNASGINRIDAFLWHQGETNSTVDTVEEYAAKLTTVFSQAKALTQFKEDSVFIAGEISKTFLTLNPSRSDINESLRIVEAQQNNPFFRVAPIGNLGVRSGDEVHFSGTGIVAGGKIFLDTFRGIDSPSSTSESVSTNQFDAYLFEGMNRILDFDARDAVVNGSNIVTAWPEKVSGGTVTFNGGSPLSENGNTVFMNNQQRISYVTGLATTQPVTVVALVTFDSASLATKNQVIIDGTTGNERILFFTGGASADGELTFSAGTNLRSTSNPTTKPPTDMLTLVAGVANGANSKVFQSDTLIESGDSGTNTFGGTIHLGNTNTGISSSEVRLHRVMVFNKELNVLELAKLERELLLLYTNP